MIIDVEGLAKRYGHTDALVDLTLQVEPGEVFGFLGPNGAGKTTAVKLLLGMARPSGGRGTVLGAPLGDRRARAGIGYLPELFRYQPWLRAREVLELHARLIAAGGRGSPRLRVMDRGATGPGTGRTEIDGVLADVGLTDRAEDAVGGFSKGMQQRLGLGVALLGSPALVILDEPTSALDPVGRADVRAIIRRARDAGSAVFLNSHMLTEVERVCDRVAIVDHGRVLASGRLDDLLGDPGVRIRVTGSPPAALAGLSRFGQVRTIDEDWISIAPIDPVDIPDVVAAIVRAGGRVHAVDPARSSLEDRFLAMVSSSGDADAAVGTTADTDGPS